MPKISLSHHSIRRGEALSAHLEIETAISCDQMQAEVYTVGVLNPEFKLGIGTTPTIVGERAFQISIPTETLQPGFYEIPIISLQSSLDSENPECVSILARKSGERLLFEVFLDRSDVKTKDEMYDEILRLEDDIEDKFAEPLLISSTKGKSSGFAVFVFVRDLLVGTRIRFSNFELLPTNSGLESIDTFNFVNEFVMNNTATNACFEYTADARLASVQANPVCVVHFPNIEAESEDQARHYCVSKTNSLLLALALVRDAGGSVFDVVMFGYDSNQATKFAITDSYTGNLLTGSFAGENAETLHKYLFCLEVDSLEAFLAQLFRQARREKHVDFQYVRLWQILEILAEGECYDPKDNLIDFEGNFIYNDDGTHRLQKGSINCVYALLRDSKIGSSKSTWEKVNMWFAIRSAVAHFGSVSQFHKLGRQSIIDWAIRANKEISKTPGQDQLLWELKEDVKLLLRRRLVSKAAMISTSKE